LVVIRAKVLTTAPGRYSAADVLRISLAQRLAVRAWQGRLGATEMLVPKAERGCMVVGCRRQHHALLLYASRVMAA
jgi:hypothetical protein